MGSLDRKSKKATPLAEYFHGLQEALGLILSSAEGAAVHTQEMDTGLGDGKVQGYTLLDRVLILWNGDMDQFSSFCYEKVQKISWLRETSKEWHCHCSWHRVEMLHQKGIHCRTELNTSTSNGHWTKLTQAACVGDTISSSLINYRDFTKWRALSRQDRITLPRSGGFWSLQSTWEVEELIDQLVHP